MYKIIGADGKEYGPITAKQLQQWIAQGRVGADTKVRPEDSPDWRTLETLTDFSEALATPPTFPNLPPPPAIAPRTSRMAIASLVLGPLGLLSCGITSLVGLVLGTVALFQISKNRSQLSGQGLAVAGTIISGVILLLMLAMVPPALTNAKAKAQSISCKSHVQAITLMAVLHSQTNNNTCPPAASWCDAILAEVGSDKAFRCTAGQEEQRCHYAYNAKLDGVKLDKIKNPSRTVMIFETEGGWNVNGGIELMLRQSRHAGEVTVGFVDGHVEHVQESGLSQLQWEP